LTGPAPTARDAPPIEEPPMRSRHILILPRLVVLLSLGACAAQTLSPADLDRQEDCRAQVDRQYEKQNRYLLSEQDQTGTPYSSHGFPGDTTSGLGDLYRRDRNIDACMRSTDPVAR
jgi:hypothetical protein